MAAQFDLTGCSLQAASGDEPAEQCALAVLRRELQARCGSLPEKVNSTEEQTGQKIVLGIRRKKARPDDITVELPGGVLPEEGYHIEVSARKSPAVCVTVSS